MTDNFPILALLISLSLCSCKDSSIEATAEDGRKLNAAGEIAAEIEQKHAIECDPFVRADDGVAQIEFNVTDPKPDYESIVPKISTFKSVQSFDGELQLLFRLHSAASDSGTVTDLARFDAKTGQRIDP